MSEQGWRAFLAADGVDDWVVLHGGATAVFRVASIDEAAGLAASIVAIPGLAEWARCSPSPIVGSRSG